MDTKKSIHYYFQYFSRANLQKARERSGLTKKALAELIGKTSSAISQFESGKCEPDFATFEILVEKLAIHPAYITSLLKNSLRLDMESCHFRANRDVTKTERVQAFRYAEDVLNVYSALERRGIVFPPPVLPVYEGTELSEREIEQYALGIRKEFQLSLGPIQDMADLLESQGVRIVLLPDANMKLDAFAAWMHDTPCIMIVGSKAASRMQFDYAHELAHLLLHTDRVSGEPSVERIANRFASAFLMPQPSFMQDCPRYYTQSTFLSVKKFWHISIGAALYRARQLGILSEARYKSAVVSMSARKIRFNEPGEFANPLPTLLRQALECVADEMTLEELAEEVSFTENELISLLRVQQIPDDLIQKMKPAQRRATILPFVYFSTQAG